jgi:HEAT repeat protein
MSPRALAASLLLCIAAAAHAPAAAPQEQDSRPGSEWDKPDHWNRLLDTAEVEKRREAFRGLLGHQGSAMLKPLREPFLRAVARDEDPRVRAYAATVVARNGRVFDAGAELNAAVPFLTGLLDHAEPETRKAAIDALGSIGPPALPALPGIRTRLREGTKPEREAAVRALGGIGGEALGELARALAGEDLDVAAGALQAFEDMKERARPALPALAELAGSEKPTVMLLASAAAANVQPRALEQSPLAEKNVARCADLLRDPEGRYGGLAIRALPAYGAKGAPAVPAVIDWYLRVTGEAKGTKDEERVEGSGLFVAGVVLFMREAAHGPLVEVMSNGDAKQKAMAAVLLGNFVQTPVPLPDAALPPLLKMLDDPDANLHMAAANVLENYGPRGKPAAPKLSRLFVAEKDRDRQVVLARALKKVEPEALGRVPEAEAMVPALIEALDGPDGTADEAAQLLALIGAGAARAVPAMLRSSLPDDADGDDDTHMLHRIAEMGAPAVPELTKALSDAETPVRKAAASALYYMAKEPAAEAALPALNRAAAEDADGDVSTEARLAANEINRQIQRRRNPPRRRVG